ncbi:hypothetical protein MYAM1_002432 [Malassezia yamatoensis]|uniref:Uncharacterized protein n=1 Tax=Malassezia yamatoensis TaxID=253288 RepID=A0AAJ6CGT5_9BASI|nr:hypothetical protein MYAM1_002432 [Malassezia yamatoensis]
MRGQPLVPRLPWSHAKGNSCFAAPIAVRARRPTFVTTTFIPSFALPESSISHGSLFTHHLYHTDLHPESSFLPRKVCALRDTLRSFSSKNIDELHTVRNALFSELQRTRPAHDAPIYQEIYTMVMSAIRRLLKQGDVQAAAEALQCLDSMAPQLPLTPRHRTMMLHLLGHPEAFSTTWRFIRRSMRDVTPSETTHAMRALLRVNHVGEAARILQWHVRRFRRKGTPPPSSALMHNFMIQMRFLGSRVDLAPRVLQNSYTEALVHFGTLLRENSLPLPSSREDLAWLIKSLYLYQNADWAKQMNQWSSNVILACLPMYVQRLPDIGDPRWPPITSSSYNALVQYTLSYAQNPHWCRLVLNHMANSRDPLLPPSSELVTILLRQAVRKKSAALGAYALELNSPDPGDDACLQTGARLLYHVECAVRDQNTYRLVSLLHYITALRLSPKRQLQHVQASSVARRVIPFLFRRRPIPVVPDPDVSHALLLLAAKAGKVTLCLRIWYWMKQHATRVPIRLASATVFMQLLAESARMPRNTLSRWAVHSPVGQRRRALHDLRLLALNEYSFLLQHWYSRRADLPDQQFFRCLLRVMRRTSHPHDTATARILKDMKTLNVAIPAR